MKRLLAALSFTLFLSVVAPCSVNAAPSIRLWPHKHHKDASQPTEATAAKPKRTLLHRGKPARDEAAKSEATYGMTGPKSVGWLHPTPGPAGYGAK